MRRKGWALLSGAGAALVLGLWAWLGDAAPPPARAAEPAAPGPAAAPAQAAVNPASAASAAAGPPPRSFGPLSEAARAEQRRAWQLRLERAQMALDGYRIHAQYPHESRPAEEHPDQMRPFEPIEEERALRMPGGSGLQGVRLKTTQERVFASGRESSRVTVSLADDAGRPLPLQISRAVMREVTPPGRTASTAEFRMPVNDSGQGGDLVAGDGVFTAVMHPAAQGFGSFAGTVRLELDLAYAGQPGFLYFDLTYSPETAAQWSGKVRERHSPAGLDFLVELQVLLPGRYVASARIDDAGGRTIAVALFNQELAAGTQELRLPAFGKLLRDKQARFPLVLRDVEAFLLKPDTFPDRVMLPRWPGAVHTSGRYALDAFSGAEWQSEERERYLAELTKDVSEAENRLRALGP